MSKKIIKLTEGDLRSIVKRVIEEQNQMNGEEVLELQNALNEYFKLKRINTKVPTDAKWGPITINALKQFQKREGINPDGIAGPETYTALRNLGLNQDFIDKLISWVGKLFN